MKHRTLIIIALILLVVAAYLFAVGFYKIPVYKDAPVSRPDAFGLYQYRGAIHIHTLYSKDSRQTVETVMDAAKINNLDFVIITDHNDIRSKSHEGEKDGLLLISGAEFSAAPGHFLALGVTRVLDSNERTYSDYFELSRKSGGLTIVSHPFNGRNPWTALEKGGFDGVEVINLKVILEETFHSRPWLIIPTLLDYSINPGYALLLIYSRPSAAIAFLDGTRSKMSITCGVDTHGFPSSSFLLGQCVNHILSNEPMNGDFRHDSRMILDSIKRGKNFIAMDGFAGADDFSFFCESSTDGARTLKMTMAGAKWADKAGAGVFQKGVLIGSCPDLSKECAIKVGNPGAARVEVTLEVPSLLYGTQKVSWIHAMACGE